MITHYDDLEPEDLSLLNQNINKSLKSACKARMRGYQEKMMICANELKPVYQRNQFQYEDRDAFCSRPNQHDMLQGVYNLEDIDSDYESARDFFKRTKVKLRRPIISREVDIQQLPRRSYDNRKNRNILNNNSSNSNESDESSDSSSTNQQIENPPQSEIHSQRSHLNQVNGSQFGLPGAPFEEFNSQLVGNMLVPQDNPLNPQGNNGQIIPLQEQQGNNGNRNGRGAHNPMEQRNDMHRNRNQRNNNNNNNQNNNNQNNNNQNNNNQNNNIVRFQPVDEPGIYLKISTFNQYMNGFVESINQGMRQVEQNIHSDMRQVEQNIHSDMQNLEERLNQKIDRIIHLLNGH